MKTMTEDDVVHHWGIPYPDVVLAEYFGVLPPSLLHGNPSAVMTVGELAKQSERSTEQVITELNMLKDMAEGIELSVDELAALRGSDGSFSEDIFLLDVRELWEFEKVKIEGSVLMDQHTLGSILPRLQGSSRLVCICHHGIRSYSAAMYLRQQGLLQAQSLSGGVDAWAKKIDPEIGVY